MVFVQMYRLIDCLNRGLPLDMDVFDGVDWSVVMPLSKVSTELGSIPIDFPDFTRGKWKGNRSHGTVANLYPMITLIQPKSTSIPNFHALKF